MSQDHKLDLEHVQLIVNTIFDATDPTMMGSQATHLLVSSMGVKGAAVLVVNTRTEALEILATEGLSLNYVNKGPILVGKSIKLAGNLKPVIIEDIETSHQLQYPEKARAEGIRSIVSLPVNLRGKIIAALRIYHSAPWAVTDQDLSFLNLITCYLGMALRYFRLSSAVQSTKETLGDIHPIWL